MIKDMKKVFGYGDDMYTITVNTGKGGEVYLNSVKVSSESSETRNYFEECSVTLSAKAYAGYKFLYWDLNGERFETDQITVDNKKAVDGKLVIKAVYEKTDVTGADIYISRIDTAGKGDSIVLYNPNSEAVTLSGYCLSDKSSQLDRWTIPTVTINAESELVIVCKNNKEESALQKLVTNFSLKTGETVYLSDPDGNVISKVDVVEMKEGEVLVRRDDGGYEIRSLE